MGLFTNSTLLFVAQFPAGLDQGLGIELIVIIALAVVLLLVVTILIGIIVRLRVKAPRYEQIILWI